MHKKREREKRDVKETFLRMQSVEKVYKEIYSRIEDNFNNLKFLSSGKNASNFASILNMKLQRT